MALLVAACAVFGAGGIRAQQAGGPAVSAALEESTVEAGEATRYQISVVNGRADSPPPVPVVAGLTFQYIGQETSESYYFDSRTGARSINTFVYNYTVRAMHAGRYVIPGQEVMVKGVAQRTPPLTLAAEDGGASGSGSTSPDRALTSELILPKRSAYLGESIPLEVRSFFGLSINGHPDPDPILTGEGFSVQKFTPAVIRPQTVDGVHYNTASYKSAIAGLKIGTLTVGPAETAPIVQMPVSPARRRSNRGGFDPFANLFGGSNLMTQEQQVKVRTEPVSLEIKPLPAGKPEDFSGGIGQFKLDVEAEPRRAQAGDPVTVRLILSGQGNFERINAPVLADERGLKTYPPKAKFKADDDVGLSGVKTFEQVVIADGARTSLPSYRFSYLDPGTGNYVSLDTAPVAVKIEGSVPAPVAPVVPPQAVPAPTVTPTPAPPHAAEDILYIRADPGAPRDQEAFLPVYLRRGFWLAQGVPLAGLLAALAGLGLRARARNEAARRQSQIQREQGELQRALRREDASRRDFYGAATRLAQLRAARGRTDSPLTAAEISQARQLDPQTASSVQAIFHRHDELAYSGGQVAQEPVPADERRGVLATLETLGKNGK